MSNTTTARNSLAMVYPKLAHLLLDEDPRTVTVRSGRSLLFGCDKGHSPRRATVQNRTGSWDKGNSGCPICSGREAEPGVNDLATVYPKWAHLLLDEDPRTVSTGSGRTLLFGCDRGHSPRRARVHSRTVSWDNGTSGCPICSGREVDPGVNDLATVYPKWAHLLLDADPHTVSTGSHHSLLFGCDGGHAPRMAEVQHRTASWDKGNSGCPICSGHEVEPGVNDLATVYPEWAHLLLDADPHTVAVRSGRTLLFDCDNGHAPQKSPVYRRTLAWDRDNSGCPSCATFGFDPAKRGWLYLLRNDVWALLQVGITNDWKRRLSEHRKTGFVELLDIQDYDAGVDALSWEASIKNFLAECLGHPLSARIDDSKFDGFTESWLMSELNVTTLVELQEMVRTAEFGAV